MPRTKSTTDSLAAAMTKVQGISEDLRAIDLRTLRGDARDRVRESRDYAAEFAGLLQRAIAAEAQAQRPLSSAQ